jgi:hypothetical protein
MCFDCDHCFFFQENKSHGAEQFYWSSVYTFTDHHVPNNFLPIKMYEVLFFQIEYISHLTVKKNTV